MVKAGVDPVLDESMSGLLVSSEFHVSLAQLCIIFSHMPS